MSAEDWGLLQSFRDVHGTVRTLSAEVAREILAAMGLEADDAPQPSPVRLVRAGGVLEEPGSLTLEDGSDLGVVQRLPADLPYGYHLLRRDDEELLLIAAPPRCPRPVERAWGWAAQLYAIRSQHSWGIGDLADLAELAAWSRGLGAGFLVLNPLHAVAPLLPPEPSPYFPSSRRFRNPLYLRPELVPGAGGVALEAAAAEARSLNAVRLIDRDRVARLKMAALEALWDSRQPDPRFDAYRAERGQPLQDWVTFCVLAEHFGGPWREWPTELRRPGGAAVGAFATDHSHRVAFHAWLQWLLDEQLDAAAQQLPLIADIAVGFDPHGADAWTWQHLLATGATVGAPPDTFNASGQDWGLPPFVPWRLQQARLAPFIETIRAVLRHAGGLRIDHVMGLFRQWWVLPERGPAEGAYVRYPADELLAIVTLEAHRAGAVVIGEDLGTVEPEMPRALAARDMLSYRLMLFEGTDASAYPELAMAAVSTHDLPTIAGLWSGADLQQQARSGLVPDPGGLAQLRAPLATLGSPTSQVRSVILAAHARLAEAPSLLVAATLDDALAVEERPNMPGTVSPTPNWSLALPRSLEEIEADPFVAELAAVLRR